MIKVTSIKNVREGEFDEVWAIVRSLKNCPKWMQQVPELSPKLDLFFAYRQLANEGRWNYSAFQNMYVPKFMQGLADDRQATADKLNYLWRQDKAGKKIALVCFCPDESTCHRSIIAGMLQGAGCNVETDTGTDLSFYFNMYQGLCK